MNSEIRCFFQQCSRPLRRLTTVGGGEEVFICPRCLSPHLSDGQRRDAYPLYDNSRDFLKPAQSRAIFFDLDGTLLLRSPTVIQTWVRFLRDNGIQVEHIDLEKWRKASENADNYVREEWDKLEGDHMSSDVVFGEKEWLSYDLAILEGLEIPHERQEELARKARSLFSNTPIKRYPAPETASVISFLRNKGWLTFVLTNRINDPRKLMTKLGLAPDLFHEVLYAGMFNARKPDRVFFDQARQWVLDRYPQEVMADPIYVGDSWFFDMEGAHGAGWIPVFLDREKVYINQREFPQPVAILTDLTQLRNRVEASLLM